MHSSIGTGSLTYAVGSKVIDLRSFSKDERQREAIVKSRQSSIDNTDNIENSCDLTNNCTDMSRAGQREISANPTNLVALRECCICLSAYDDGLELRELPCGHYFHCACVDKWLYINATCPLCKYNILKGSSSQEEEV